MACFEARTVDPGKKQQSGITLVDLVPGGGQLHPYLTLFCRTFGAFLGLRLHSNVKS
jgi:hypothetical protein